VSSNFLPHFAIENTFVINNTDVGIIDNRDLLLLLLIYNCRYFYEEIFTNIYKIYTKRIEYFKTIKDYFEVYLKIT